MNFLYIARVNLKTKTLIGVVNKIKSQISCLEDFFDEIYLLCMSKNKIVLLRFKGGELFHSKMINYASKENDFSIFWTEAKLLINQSFYNLVYFRYDFSRQSYEFINFTKSTEKLKSILCCEIPTYPFYNELNDRKNIEFEKNVVKEVSTYCDHIFSPSRINKIHGRKRLQ